MRRKIEWYQEVLSLEPGSRVFFPLAKLFVEFGQFEDAEKTLRQGLDRHPDSMEARLLLIQVLSRLERTAEAAEQLQTVIKPLERYPAFWSLWAQQSAEKDRDFSVFLMLVASHFTDKPVKWTDVLIEGMHSLAERLVGPPKTHTRKTHEPAAAAAPKARHVPPPVQEPQPQSYDGCDAPYEGPAPDAGSFRTRTMAELLASQGDFSAALGIYRDLLALTDNAQEKTDLSSRIKTLEAGQAAAAQTSASGPGVNDDPFGKHAKNRLMSTLEALAARLESRIPA